MKSIRPHLLLLTFMLSGYCTAAQKTEDSLRAVIAGNNNYPATITAILAYCTSYNNIKNFDQVIETGGNGITLAYRNNDSVPAAILHRCIGVAHYFKGHFDTAATHYYQSAAILERHNKPAELAYTSNELAKLYRKTRDLDRSLEWYNKAMNLFRTLKDTGGIAMIWNESGVVFEYRGDYAEAKRRYGQALALHLQRHDSVGIGYALNFMAGVAVLEKKYAEAEQLMLQCINIRSRMKDSFGLALAYTDLGAAYNAAGKYEQARQSLLSSNAIAAAIGYPDLQRNAFTELALLSEKQGDYKQAYEFGNRANAIKDSLFTLEKTQQVEELNTRYQTARKEQLIQKQQARLRYRNTVIIAGAAFFVLALLLGYSWYRRYRLKQAGRLQQEIMRQQDIATKAIIEAEEKERQRIAADLHDGVGQTMSAAKMNLSAWQDHARFDNEDQKMAFDKIVALVDESAREIRGVSHNLMPNALLKAGLANAVREFIDKLDSRVLKVDLYSEGLNEKVDSNVETVLYRVIQECVNNVIKHAGASRLDISLIRDENEISVTIEDNGRGFDTANAAKFNGVGLKSIRSRVEYLRGGVEFSSAPGKGTLVAIHIPLLNGKK